jgi:hypothetical protein
MLTKDLPWSPAHAEHGRARLLAATALHGASLALGRLARRLAAARRGAAHADPVLEFYADASAPEGALYVDGQLVGHLSGVKRL